MKSITIVFISASCALVALDAQTINPAFDFRSIAKPGMAIEGHVFTSRATVGFAALNNAGEIAFAAYDGDGPDSGAVYTSRRIVAKSGDMSGGKTIMSIPRASHVAINGAGQVAFEAWYADAPEVARAGAFSGLGIFVGERLALKAALNDAEKPPAFTLSEDGEVSLGDTPRPVTAPIEPPKTTSILDRVRIKPPRNLPITISGHGSEPNRSLQRRPADTPQERSPALFPMNRHGEILIPVNFRDGGFLLLLGSPR